MRPDVPNRALLWLSLAVVAFVCAWLGLLRPHLPEPWRTPGSVELYFCGVAGALLLLVPMAFSLSKRSGTSSPPGWFVAHVLASFAGVALIAIHSAGYMRRPPALLIVMLVALLAIGVWGRTRGSRDLAATFAGKQRAFTPADPARRAAFAEIVEMKRRILQDLDAGADEATFSPTLRHWLRSPALAWRYARLAEEERGLMAAFHGAGSARNRWRLAHMLIAYAFVAGLAIHVITVTFFAGYVADGGPITWWHLAK